MCGTWAIHAYFVCVCFFLFIFKQPPVDNGRFVYDPVTYLFCKRK